MQAKQIVARVEELVRPLCEQAGVSLWDVEFEKEGGQYMLTVTVDHPEGVNIDQCEQVSRALDPMLDAKEFDDMPSYTLCVSSAGLSRRLKRPEHFEAFMGQTVEVGLYKAMNGAKQIPVDYMLDRVGQALITAYKRDNDGMTDNVYVEPNREEKTIRMYVRKTVVRTEDLYEPYEEITLEEAADYKVNPQVGDVIDIDIPTKSFGRIAAQTAKQVIIQGIREAERGMVISEFESKEHEILNATVARIDPRSGNAYLDVVSGGEKSEAVLTASEQVRGETLVEGQHVKVYLIEVRRGTRGVQVIVSRTHPGLVKRLFELEVPEIHSGVVEVKSIAREAGNRTKIAVTSHDENVDPIGACVGTRGARVSNITSELNGEKIDIIKWNEDTATFVSAALAPADVISASMQADGKSCRVIVPDDQLSLAIGKEGQNARLAAKLTGCKIDIAPKSQAQAEPQEPVEAPAEEPQTEPQAE